MIHKYFIQTFICAVLILSFPLAVTGEPTPEQILTDSDSARGHVEGLKWRIDLHSVENKRIQNRSLEIKAKGFNSLAKFLSPAKVKGRKLLMLDRNMWFIKPGLRKPVPISPRQKLMGNASNGDIASTNYAGDYRIDSFSRVLLDEKPCYLFSLKGKSKKVTYDAIRYWVTETGHLGIKAEFYTVSGKKLKTAFMEYGNRLTVDTKPIQFISRMVIHDAVKAANITEMNYRNIKIKPIPDSTFNINLLAR